MTRCKLSCKFKELKLGDCVVTDIFACQLGDVDRTDHRFELCHNEIIVLCQDRWRSCRRDALVERNCGDPIHV